MTVERLGPVDPVSKFNKSDKTSKPVKKDGADSISFSEEARSKGEIYRATEEAKLAPEIRQDRVDEVKKKLQDPNYINDKVIEAVAEQVIDLFEL